MVGKDDELRSEILKFFHGSPMGGHSGVHASTKRATAVVYWKGLRKDMKRFVRGCEVRQQNKHDLQHPRGLLQSLPIPEKAWASISMDFVEGLPKSQGKEVIFVVVDRLTKYGHFIDMTHPYTALDVARVFMEQVFRLHGLPETIVCDRDRVFMSIFWRELFLKLGVVITPSTAYHPETDDQTERVNQSLETYLRCMTGERPMEWSSWLYLAEWWYNTSYHSEIKSTPHMALYGQEPSLHLPYLAGESPVAQVDRSLQQREAAVQMMKFHLKRAQKRMKQQADKQRTECELNLGDWVYLKLQPYRQHSVQRRICHKLAPKWFGPYQIDGRVGKVAYRLNLPAGSRVHPVFHVSQLKKHIGSDPVQSELPVIGVDGAIAKEPVKILERRMVKKGNRAVTEVLVEWTNSFPEDATWENLYKLQQQFPSFNP
ncbi:hypothetical protein HRI_000161800 [Hibiscus trionum]|uniref:Integrase catalytic domain-containing protein n=1 Tax=Hibiscus trionum TaxID=183268 RepID=A0A9W7LIR0_HIBTR|nr:hypothetical protein HRI_000161800 [Hibiscus trionum]